MLRSLYFSRMTATLLCCVTLISCAANPVRVNITEAGDSSLNCWQLASEIKRAEQYKIDARKDDRFRLQDMFLTTGMMSIYNINKAESNAIKRSEHLQSLFQQKHCQNASQSNNTTIPPKPPLQAFSPSYPNDNYGSEIDSYNNFNTLPYDNPYPVR